MMTWEEQERLSKAISVSFESRDYTRWHDNYGRNDNG